MPRKTDVPDPDNAAPAASEQVDDAAAPPAWPSVPDLAQADSLRQRFPGRVEWKDDEPSGSEGCSGDAAEPVPEQLSKDDDPS